MMRPLPAAERVAVVLWLIVGVVVWNGLYDILLTRGATEFLFRAALHDAGRGPAVSMADVMDLTVRNAIWIATLWASLIVLAGLVTIRLLRRPHDQPSQPGEQSTALSMSSESQV